VNQRLEGSSGSTPHGALRWLVWLAAMHAIVAFATPSLAQRPLRILFIGNSLTAWNDLPDTVARLAIGGGQPQPLTRSVTVGGFSLEDHWNQGEARRAIGESPWDFVVLQQGPSALPESRRLLVAFARRFAEAIEKAGARPALYMVWPSADRRFDAGAVGESYRAAATAIGGRVLAAGDAWTLLLSRPRGIPLYSPDGLHPTPAGSYLAALVIYQGLYERSPIGLPPIAGVSAADARALQDAAAAVQR
jgi:hypothetical protein